METKKVLLLASVLVLVIAGFVAAARDKVLDEAVTADGATDAVVDFEFGAGDFTITPRDMADVAAIHATYDPEDVDVIIEKNVKGSTLFLSAESDFDNNDDDDNGHHHRNHITNNWDVSLSTRFPMEVNMDIGAAEADLDFGGVPIRELSLDIGAASGTLDFSKPNPERLENLKIEAGASSLNLLHLGNANFKHFKFSGGAGSFDLDLRGEYHGESEVEFEIGVSSADIILPEDIPVRIETEGNEWFSSVDIHGGDLDEVEDGIFQSPGFDKATTRIVIRIEVGMGSADFRFKA